MLIALLLGLSAWTAAAPQQPAPFTASTDLVVVPVVVLDRKGQTVRNLTAADFAITEDGKPVAIQTFTAPDAAADGPGERRFVVLVLDNLRTPAELAWRVRAIAMRFVDRMGPGDTMNVISVARGQAVTTSDKVALKAAVDRFKPAFGETIRTFEEDTEHTLRTVSELSEQMSKAPHRRKVMALIGNTALFNPQRTLATSAGMRNLSEEWFEAIRQTARYNVSVYSIDPVGLTEGGYRGDYATSFSAETGGWAWANTNNFGGAAEQIWREAGHYYVLGYSTPINDHRLHAIDVKVNVKGVTVRARRGRG